MTPPAIVVQNFNKPDTLEALCTSLLSCDSIDQYDLIFYSDSPFGANKEAAYLEKCTEVARFLDSFAATYRDRFASITLRRNPTNFGCYKTCRIALDYAFAEHDFVIFSEDDTIFSPDALDWFRKMQYSSQFNDDSIWAIAGESIFFDARRATPTKEFIEAAKVHATKHLLWDKFIPFDFIPSTCFATSRRKWADIAVTRGETNGDVTLCHRCRNEGKKCLFPVVARVKDVGMLHPDGYSVAVHTAENVASVKNCYLMSGDIAPTTAVASEFHPFDGDAGLLFWQSTDLNGFEAAAIPAPAGMPAAESRHVDLIRNARKAGLDSDWNLALRLWRELKRTGLVNPEVDVSIGLCLLKLGDHKKGREVVQHVLSLHPNDGYALSVFAHILEADKDFTGASRIWNQLSKRAGLPEWLTASAAQGHLRCMAAEEAHIVKNGNDRYERKTNFDEWWKNELYSQFGEDSILLSYFRSKAYARSGKLDDIGLGYYVDIGCHHPFMISNTWFFYQRGWRGINVDPSPGVKESFDAIRPDDINLQIAIAATDGAATLYAYATSNRNTLVAPPHSQEEVPKKLDVESVRLDTLLDRYLPADQEINILSVDVEGLDLDVLRSNDWLKYRPELVVVEHHETSIQRVISSEVHTAMADWGYTLFGWAQPSLIFLRR